MKRTGALRAAALSLFLVSGSSQLVAQECGGATAAADRQRCDDMFTRSIQTAGQTSQLPGGWRLAKIPDPRGGPQVVSVFHTADTGASDFNFAGLTFRCGGTGIETLLILLQPLPRRSQYVVRIKGGSVETQFEASTLQAGEVLLLPPSVTALANGSWQAISDLSVDITAPSPIHGVVPITGLSGALSVLSQSCRLQ